MFLGRIRFSALTQTLNERPWAAIPKSPLECLSAWEVICPRPCVLPVDAEGVQEVMQPRPVVLVFLPPTGGSAPKKNADGRCTCTEDLYAAYNEAKSATPYLL